MGIECQQLDLEASHVEMRRSGSNPSTKQKGFESPDAIHKAQRPSSAPSTVSADTSLTLGPLIIPMKHVSMLLLVAQTVAAIITLRISRTVPLRDGEYRYLYTTQVFMSELCKLIGSAGLVLLESGASGLKASVTAEIVNKPLETVKVGVPAFLYVVQNNLISVALENVSAAVYQVTYQLKILTTALLSVLILRKHLSPVKWGALVGLTIGVALIQTPTQSSGSTTEISAAQIKGISAILVACLTSGFAGVYFEKILKNSRPSIWVRNIQLALISCVLSLIGAFWNDGPAIRQNGFFQGYNHWAWAVILLQSIGGLIVAAVLKYADNILKCFGNAIAIIITCAISYLFIGDFIPTTLFAVGTIFVILATLGYSI